jgi:succinate dehydrogenase / fumarate reductase iron-sulfur subunit
MCGLVINGIAHGPERATTTCQLHMRHFKDGDTITVEPWRAKAFPVQKDLIVDRSSFDRLIAAGGYVSINTGGAQDANAILVPKDRAELAMDSAACIGCGACGLVRRGQGIAPRAAAPGSPRAHAPRARHGPPDGRRGIRELLERGGMRGGLPEADPDGEHRAPAAGVLQGAAGGTMTIRTEC